MPARAPQDPKHCNDKRIPVLRTKEIESVNAQRGNAAERALLSAFQRHPNDNINIICILERFWGGGRKLRETFAKTLFFLGQIL